MIFTAGTTAVLSFTRANEESHLCKCEITGQKRETTHIPFHLDYELDLLAFLGHRNVLRLLLLAQLLQKKIIPVAMHTKSHFYSLKLVLFREQNCSEEKKKLKIRENLLFL